MSLTLTINGEARSYDGDLRAPLADVLRETFGLIGTKPVCGEGFCGACTVLVDGEAVPACLRPVGLLIGRRIVTIEGLSAPAELNRIQEALAEHDVVQCGMCFPGIVMSLSDLLARNPAPSRSEVKSALTGNACRCTGYERIVDAVLSLTRPEDTPT